MRFPYVEGLRLDDGELLLVIGPAGDDNLIADYTLRWSIETLYGIFKTRGFCLESTHFAVRPRWGFPSMGTRTKTLSQSAYESWWRY